MPTSLNPASTIQKSGAGEESVGDESKWSLPSLCSCAQEG